MNNHDATELAYKNGYITALKSLKEKLIKAQKEYKDKANHYKSNGNASDYAYFLASAIGLEKAIKELNKLLILEGINAKPVDKYE